MDYHIWTKIFDLMTIDDISKITQVSHDLEDCVKNIVLTAPLFKCYHMENISQYRNLVKLTCERTDIETLSGFPNLTYVNIFDCKLLTKIDKLPNITWLMCQCCQCLVSINDTPNLRGIKLEYCDHIKNIANLEKITYFSCRYCNTFLSDNIENMAQLTHLYSDDKNIGNIRAFFIQIRTLISISF